MDLPLSSISAHSVHERAPGSARSGAAHSPRLHGRFAWLTCLDDDLIQACSSHDSRVDALLAATERGLVEAVRAYVGAHSASPEELGACLIRAAAAGRHNVVAELLRDGSHCPTGPVDAAGATPAHRAADGNHATVVQLLAERGANCGVQDALGRTPLHAAAASCATDAAAELLKAGVRAAAADDRGRTALDVARAGLRGAEAGAGSGRGFAAGAKEAARWRRLVTVLGGDEPPAAGAGPRGGLGGPGADDDALLGEEGGPSGGAFDVFAEAAAAAASPAPPSSAAPTDLRTLLVMLLAKLKASVDQARAAASAAPRPRCHPLLRCAGHLPRLRRHPRALCGLGRALRRRGRLERMRRDGHHGCAGRPPPCSSSARVPLPLPPAVLPDLLPELMERLTGRADATSVSREEFVAFFEELSRQADA